MAQIFLSALNSMNTPQLLDSGSMGYSIIFFGYIILKRDSKGGR